MKLVIIFFTTILLMGCDTTYQPLGWDGGYEDKQLATNHHWVKYQGNSTTPMPWVTKSWHIRAAELCVKGYDVVVLQFNEDTDGKKILENPLHRNNPLAEGQIMCK